MPFLLHQNITKLCEPDADLHLLTYDKNILHFILFQFCVSSKTGSTRSILRGIFPQKAEPAHRSQRALLSSRGLTWLEFIAFKIDCK